MLTAVMIAKSGVALDKYVWSSGASLRMGNNLTVMIVDKRMKGFD